MDFIVEKISEDSFYINLLVGLPQLLVLIETMGINEYNLVRFPPVSEPEIIQWEHKHGVTLPEDLHDFYSSINGFLYEWFYDFKGNRRNLGKVEVNSLENLKQIFGYVTTSEPGISKKDQIWEIKLSLESKVFEICSVSGGKVVLVYLFPKLEPSVWFFTCVMDFCYLSKDFKTYLKMCIAHVGIPNWQFAFTPEGISEWTKNHELVKKQTQLKYQRKPLYYIKKH
ncbi:tubulin polyglutamylase complex subunit 2 [Agrilus planipennis]|uniref:Tubulin polyglutamylase complex subunit 2 n=1 Tax=Agrilus planipennis TaxID=224129 RepID=A0A7F5R5T9_AGRPL|nr:tubulin polyglutamylase complex subunit 2 [Agrilus planipennis]